MTNPSIYEVNLEVFEGPLDLLLHLIRKQDMDIQDIQISEITQEYLAYLQVMKEMNLDKAGEFLIMASTLMHIKSQMLLPKAENVDGESAGPDPRAELAARLEEYQKFKEVSKVLVAKELEGKEKFYRNVLPLFGKDEYTLQASIFDLIDAFKMVLQQAKDDVRELLYTDIPLEQKVREILDVLAEKKSVSFFEIFSDGRSRRELIVTFLALLELIRLKQIIARQSESLSEIWIYQVQNEVQDAQSIIDEMQPRGAGVVADREEEEVFIPAIPEEEI